MQRNIKPSVFENVAGISIGTFVQDEVTHFKLDGSYPFLVSNVTIKQGGVEVPASSYTLFIDNDATLQEVGKTDAQLYGAIKITNAVYSGVELNFTGQNFGSYVSNDGAVDYVDKSITTLSNTVSPLLSALYLNGIPIYSASTDYLANVSFCQDEGMIWVSNFGTVGVPNVGNKPSVNQDKWYPVSAPTTKLEIGTGDTIPSLFKHVNSELDTNLGDNPQTLPDGTFEGQQHRITVDGTGLAKITATGIDYIVYVSLILNSIASHEVVFTWSNGRYTVSGGVSAEYTSVEWIVLKNADRSMKMSASLSKDNGTTSDQTYSFPETFRFTPYQQLSMNGQLDRLLGVTFVGTTQISMQVRSNNSNGDLTSVARSGDVTLKGQYL